MINEQVDSFVKEKLKECSNKDNFNFTIITNDKVCVNHLFLEYDKYLSLFIKLCGARRMPRLSYYYFTNGSIFRTINPLFPESLRGVKSNSLLIDDRIDKDILKYCIIPMFVGGEKDILCTSILS